MKRTKMAILLATTLTAGSLSGIVVQAAGPVTEPPAKVIQVSYDNSTVPSPDGTWGLSIPTKLTFSDQPTADSPEHAKDGYTVAKNFDVTLKALNGYDITKGDLKVNIKLSSLNNFEVKYNATLVPYTVKYAKTTADDATVNWNATGTGSDNDKIEAQKKADLSLPILDGTHTTTKGTAQLKSGTKADPGQYSDTLTYTVTHTGTLTQN